MRSIWRFGAAVALVCGIAALAQVPAAPRYGYEVVSIKKAEPDARGNRIGPGPQGGLRTRNTTLMTLLTFSYDVREYQVIDAPGWAKTEGFDVSFTPDGPETLPEPGADIRAMETMMDRQRQRMQAILRDRFGLKVRAETRELPIYELTVARSGSKLKRAEAGTGPSIQGNPGTGDLTAVGANMRALTGVFSQLLGRPVVDHTGIEENFDLKLHWKPDAFVGGPGGPPQGEPGSTEAEGASIFTAVTEQLGLKLDSKKGPVTVYVLEKAERPTEN